MEELQHSEGERTEFDHMRQTDVHHQSDVHEADSSEKISDDTLNALQSSLSSIQAHLSKMQALLANGAHADVIQPAVTEMKRTLTAMTSDIAEENGKIIEGVFDGEFMIGANGNKYNVPPNYASKSKLVEGDLLKLTIGEKGNFIYKQILPIERDRIVGVLSKDPETGEYYVEVDHDQYKVINASVTYFKGMPGDEAVILKPKNTKSKWAALENIIKRHD